MFNKFDYIGNYCPSELKHLQSGDLVKVSHMNETFWVSLKCSGGRRLKGKVDNDLFLDHGFSYGDSIKFNASHVLRYELEKKDSKTHLQYSRNGC